MLSLRSPAKMNLFLRIVRRREDGYHELASLFQTIDLCDRLHVDLSSEDRLVCNQPHIPTDRSNLIWKSVDAFRRKTGIVQPLFIELDKVIPIEAGLGGGSSNATTMLWALNTIFKNPLSHDEMMSVAAEVGSDTAFFLSCGTAYCTGRGEVVSPVKLPNTLSCTIVKPAYGLSTPLVYRTLKAAELAPRCPDVYLKEWLNGTHNFFNDLEIPAYQIAPQLLQLKTQLLNSGYHNVILAGSGSSLCCFGPGSVPKDPSLQVFTARFLTRSSNSWY